MDSQISSHQAQLPDPPRTTRAADGARSAAVQALRLLSRTVHRGPLAARGYGPVYAASDRLAPARPVVARVAGQRMALDLRERYNRYLFYREVENVEEYRLFCERIRPGMTVIDVGANIGLFTLAAAHRVGPQGRVFAFEPLARNHRFLVANLALNGYDHAIAEPMAVGDRDGTLEVHLFGSDSTSVSSIVSGPADAATQAVPCCRLDTYLHEHGMERADMVKIDVEGAEGAVLEGMQELLQGKNPPALVVEVHPDFLESVGSTAHRVLHLLAAHGHTLWHLRSDGAVHIGDIDSFQVSGQAADGGSRRFRVYAQPPSEARPPT